MGRTLGKSYYDVGSGKLDKILDSKDGFDDREIKGFVEDKTGDIWIGNHEGLYCFNTANNRLIKFSMNDGLLSNNTSTGFS